MRFSSIAREGGTPLIFSPGKAVPLVLSMDTVCQIRIGSMVLHASCKFEVCVTKPTEPTGYFLLMFLKKLTGFGATESLRTIGAFDRTSMSIKGCGPYVTFAINAKPISPSIINGIELINLFNKMVEETLFFPLR